MNLEAFTIGGFFAVFSILFLAIVLRYFAAAGLFSWYYYGFRKHHYRSLSKKKATASQKKKEIRASLYASAIFAFFGWMTYGLWQNDLTAIYLNLDKFGYWYLPLSLFLLILLHETYYYWIHRWMHLPQIYRKVHKVHHDSRTPTPWTAFSFHPIESLLEAIILPFLLLFIPVHLYVLGAYLLLMTLSSVINHLDIEIYPKAFRESWVGKQFIGATHHHYHHKDFLSNFGLYLTFWDRWMATENRKTSTGSQNRF